jgi:hypothetical protein
MVSVFLRLDDIFLQLPICLVELSQLLYFQNAVRRLLLRLNLRSELLAPLLPLLLTQGSAEDVDELMQGEGAHARLQPFPSREQLTRHAGQPTLLFRISEQELVKVQLLDCVEELRHRQT